MGSIMPTRKQSEHAAKLATKRWEERPMNNDIKHLPNGDFEVVKPYTYATKTRLGPVTETGRRAVLLLIKGKWEHKGWLMPHTNG